MIFKNLFCRHKQGSKIGEKKVQNPDCNTNLQPRLFTGVIITQVKRDDLNIIDQHIIMFIDWAINKDELLTLWISTVSKEYPKGFLCAQCIEDITDVARIPLK